MGKIIQQKISRFDGGIANDLRSSDATKCAFTKQFDTLSFPHRLVPYRSYEAGNDTVNRKLHKFLYQGGKLYAQGFIPATPTVYDPQVFYKTVFSDGTWTTPANSSDPVSLATYTPGDLFIYYNGFIYGQASNVAIFKFDVTEVAAFVLADKTINLGSAVQGVVHTKDGILYVSGKAATTAYPAIWTNNLGTWSTNPVFTMPLKGYTVTSVCEYGDYLAIALTGADPINDQAKMVLWDRDTSNTLASSVTDWGVGSLNVLEVIDGELIGISLEKREQSNPLLFKSTLRFKRYAGAQGAIEFARIEGTDDASITPLTFLGTRKQKVNNRLYFTAILTTKYGSQSREGVWSIGRSSPNAPWSITVEYESRLHDGTVPTSIDGFHIVGSYAFIAYSNSGSLSGNVSKTNDAATFSANSTYESLILDGGDASVPKKLIGVTVNTTPMPAAGQIVLKYRIDENINSDTASWNTIFTNTTDNSVSHSAVNIESTGANLPEFKEIQFQIISTGGAEITGFDYKAEVIDKKLY